MRRHAGLRGWGGHASDQQACASHLTQPTRHRAKKKGAVTCAAVRLMRGDLEPHPTAWSTSYTITWGSYLNRAELAHSNRPNQRFQQPSTRVICQNHVLGSAVAEHKHFVKAPSPPERRGVQARHRPFPWPRPSGLNQACVVETSLPNLFFNEGQHCGLTDTCRSQKKSSCWCPCLTKVEI